MFRKRGGKNREFFTELSRKSGAKNLPARSQPRRVPGGPRLTRRLSPTLGELRSVLGCGVNFHSVRGKLMPGPKGATRCGAGEAFEALGKDGGEGCKKGCKKGCKDGGKSGK